MALGGGPCTQRGEPGPSPMLERVVERSRIACLPRLLRMERLARDRSAVMWVMEILGGHGDTVGTWGPAGRGRRGVLGGVMLSPAVESVLEEVEEGFLHHVGDLPWGRQRGEPRQMAPAGRWQPLSTVPPPSAVPSALCRHTVAGEGTRDTPPR